jgi:hypothetical protein
MRVIVGTIPTMSTRELLREFRALPADKQEKFLREARVSGQRASGAPRPARRIAWPDIESRAKRITGERVLPNLILLQRDEAAY